MSGSFFLTTPFFPPNAAEVGNPTPDEAHPEKTAVDHLQVNISKYHIVSKFEYMGNRLFTYKSAIKLCSGTII